MMAAAIAAMALGELLGPAAGAHAALTVTDLVLDSRQIRDGAAFVAVRGTVAHGLNFAGDALARGAAIVLYEPDDAVATVPEPGLAVAGLSGRIGALARKFFWRERSQPRLCGVTGTNGKTTVAYVVAQALTRLGRDCGYIGTLGYGRADALSPHPLTTPDCFTLHRELAGLATEYAMLEVSSHGLAQNRTAGLDFTITAVTNLSRDHLDAHGSMAEYAEVKSRIVRLPGLDTVVLNLDDRFAAGLRSSVGPGIRVIGTSTRAAAGAGLAADVKLRGFDGIELDVSHEGRRARLHSPLIGAFNADNLLLALGFVIAAGADLSEAAPALAACRPAPGRMEVFGGGQAPHIVVDYAHTPTALERTLAVLDRLRAGSLTCVFGCGGDRDAGKRALMGRAAGIADRVVLTDDNPRTEDPAAIIADIRRGIESVQVVEIEHDRERAIRRTIAAAAPGDVVLIAGKGHESTQSVRGEVRPLDDRQIVREALGSLG